MRSVAILQANMIHYHAARFAAAKRLSGLDVSFVQVTNKDSSSMKLQSELAEGVITLTQASDHRQIAPQALRRVLFDALDKLQPDTVAVNGWAFAGSLFAMLWARQRGRRIVVCSESSAHDAPRRRSRELIKRGVLSVCDAALVGGRTHKAYMLELGMPPDRVFEGYDAVDNSYFGLGAKAAKLDASVFRRELGLPERYVLASARFVPKKNLPRLIEAFASVSKAIPDCPTLVILGDGPERPIIQAAIAASGIGDLVQLYGFAGYPQLPSIYGLAEAFVHVPTTEQWGLVVNEAAAAGLPLIVSKPCGSAAELVREGVNGYRVDPLRADDIGRALLTLLQLTAERRAEMGEASLSLVSEWGVERYASGLAAACQAGSISPRPRTSVVSQALIGLLARQQFQLVQ